jgi:hypothetical protein
MAAPVINTSRTSNIASRRPMTGVRPLPNGATPWTAGDLKQGREGGGGAVGSSSGRRTGSRS